MSTISGLDWDSKCWFLWREEAGGPGEKPRRARERTNENKFCSLYAVRIKPLIITTIQIKEKTRGQRGRLLVWDMSNPKRRN